MLPVPMYDVDRNNGMELWGNSNYWRKVYCGLLCGGVLRFFFLVLMSTKTYMLTAATASEASYASETQELLRVRSSWCYT